MAGSSQLSGCCLERSVSAITKHLVRHSEKNIEPESSILFVGGARHDGFGSGYSFSELASVEL
jgi:hypothetical protein